LIKVLYFENSNTPTKTNTPKDDKALQNELLKDIELKNEIEKIDKELKKKVREAKVVKVENLHITLKFLGEVEEERIKEIDEKLNEISKRFVPFSVFIKNIGSFPEEKKIRVLWVGVESEGNLKKLNLEIEKELSNIGFKEENRFKEHITISRFKSTPDLKFIEYLKEKYNKTLGSFDVSGFSLIKSNLTSQGPIYNDLKEYKFGGNNGKRKNS